MQKVSDDLRPFKNKLQKKKDKDLVKNIERGLKDNFDDLAYLYKQSLTMANQQIAEGY